MKIAPQSSTNILHAGQH